jgi:hypothetical protein
MDSFYLNELTRKRVPGREIGLISGSNSISWEKIEGSAEALWASHCPKPSPPKEPNDNTGWVTIWTKLLGVTEYK